MTASASGSSVAGHRGSHRAAAAYAAELVERRVAAEGQLKRIDIRAPSAGFVHQLAVHTVGGVITPAEPAMLIVPAEDSLQLEVRINPPDIDQIALGRPARVKLHAFNQRTTPELDLLYRSGLHSAGRDRPSRAPAHHCRHAGRRLRPDRGPHPAGVHRQAAQGPDREGIQGEVIEGAMLPPDSLPVSLEHCWPREKVRQP